MNSLDLERRSKDTGNDKVFRCTGDNFPPAINDPELIGTADGEVQVMRGEKDGLFCLLCYQPEDPHGLDLVGEIEERCRLVKYHQFGLLRKGPGNHDFLPLAVAHLVDKPACEVAGTY